MSDRELGYALLCHARVAIAERLGMPATSALGHDALARHGATFVTLMRHGELRGCIGTLEAFRELAIDTSHFTGQGWNVGARFRPCPRTPLDELLVADRWTTSHHLKKRLLRAGIKAAACELCGWAEQAPDGRVPIELDHINCDKHDNRFENLRILCPNCHALQPTHRGLNRKRRRS